MSYWDEITARLAALSGVATPQVARQQLREFDVRDIEAVRVSEGGGGGGNVPFVGVDPPGSPTDGMLWWDPDDDTPAPSETQPFTVVRFSFAYNTPNILTGVPIGHTTAAGEVFTNKNGWYAPSPVWNGTTPQLTIFAQGDNPATDKLVQEPVDIANVALGAHAHDIQTCNIGPFSGNAVIFDDAVPLYLLVDDGAGGDPGASQGAGEIVIFINPASVAP